MTSFYLSFPKPLASLLDCTYPYNCQMNWFLRKRGVWELLKRASHILLCNTMEPQLSSEISSASCRTLLLQPDIQATILPPHTHTVLLKSPGVCAACVLTGKPTQPEQKSSHSSRTSDVCSDCKQDRKSSRSLEIQVGKCFRQENRPHP